MLVKKGKCDYWILLAVLCLLGIGLVMVLSSSQYFAQHKPYEDSFYFLKRQAGNAAVGLLGMYVVSKINYKFYQRHWKGILILGIGLVLFVLFSSLGSSSGGSERWIDLKFIRFQPSDVLKLSMVIFIAAIFSKKRIVGRFRQDFFLPLVAIGIICALVAINDLGTAIVMAGTGVIMLLVAGMRAIWIIAIGGAGLLAVAAAVIHKPYRMKRITGFLDPWADPLGDGYQAVQSLLAIGSGGFMGVGLGEGGSKWFYLPERHTDFIFSVLVEEWGFIGGAGVILLFLFFTFRGIQIAINTEDKFASLLAIGVTLMVSLQAMVNIGIALGMMPVTGITLPFISYGGTSLVISLMGVGILLNISKYSKIR